MKFKFRSEICASTQQQNNFIKLLVCFFLLSLPIVSIYFHSHWAIFSSLNQLTVCIRRICTRCHRREIWIEKQKKNCLQFFKCIRCSDFLCLLYPRYASNMMAKNNTGLVCKHRLKWKINTLTVVCGTIKVWQNR